MTNHPPRIGEAESLARDIRAWLGSGRIQSPAGAYCAWRDGATGALAFEYPEITGYALTWLAGRHGLSDAETAAGRAAADWMTDRLEAGDRSARAGWDGGAVYTFDLGMIAAGLISFGKRVDDARYTEAGRALAADLAGYVGSGAGLEAVAPDGPATSRPSSWSTEGVPHLTKCVQALLLAEEHSAADTLMRTAAEHHQDGHFATQPDVGYVMLHPHLYTVEGLWMHAEARGDADSLRLARQATEWAWSHQLATGGLPRYAALDPSMAPAPEQWDVTAQAIRAALMTGVRPDGLETAVARLIELARPAGDGRALVYQPDSGEAHHNAWVSMFGGQALELYSSGAQVMAWDDLV